MAEKTNLWIRVWLGIGFFWDTGFVIR